MNTACFTGAAAIGLSITHPPDDPRVGDELKDLRRATGPDLPILVGGQAAPSYRHIIDSIGAVYLRDFAMLRRALADVSRSL